MQARGRCVCACIFSGIYEKITLYGVFAKFLVPLQTLNQATGVCYKMQVTKTNRCVDKCVLGRCVSDGVPEGAGEARQVCAR